MSAFSEDFESLNLSALLRRFKDRLSPEVRAALATIVGAVLEDPKRRSWKDDAHLRQQRERIERAERGVKTRRENQKKVGVGKKPRPAERRTKKRCSSRYVREGDRSRKVRAYCALKRGHRNPHQSEDTLYPKFIWPNSSRASKKPAPLKPKPKSPLRKSKSK